MRTHEASDGATETQVEFCWDPLYWSMYDCYSTTYPNGSAFQAWRAGFREGVKMCLNQGHRPTVSEFRERVHRRNLDHLTIWHNIGSDVEHGRWAMAGARQGTYMTMLTDWDYTEVQDFTKLKQLWDKYSTEEFYHEDGIAALAEGLKTKLGLPITTLNAEQSKFFKHHYNSQFKNKGIMVRE